MLASYYAGRIAELDGHAGAPVCIFCGPSLAQLLVRPEHRPLQLHQSFPDDWLVPANIH